MRFEIFYFYCILLSKDSLLILVKSQQRKKLHCQNFVFYTINCNIENKFTVEIMQFN